MTIPTRAAKPRRGSRRPGWALLTALLVLAIGSGIALVFTDKAIYLRVGLLLALWAAVIASFAALTYRRQSDADQAKVHDQKLVYDLQLEREISARREYELTVESRLRQQLAGEIEAQAADEIATLRAELAALRTNLEILFNTELSDRPAIEHDPIRALGPWPGAEPEPTGYAASVREPEPASAFTQSVREPEPAEYQDVAAVEEDTRTSEYPIIDVAEDPHHVDEDEAPPTPPYPTAPYAAEQYPAGSYYGAAQPHEPEPYQQPVSSGTHWRPQPEPHVPPPPVQEPAAPAAAESAQQPYWAARQEDWDAAADGEDWDPVPAPMAPPEQPAPHPVWNAPAPDWNAPPPPPPAPSGWSPAPAEGQWLPPGTAGSNWAAASEPAVPPPPSPYQAEPTGGRHSGTPSRHQAPAAAETGGGGHWAPEPSYPPPPPAPDEPQASSGGRRRAPEPEEAKEPKAPKESKKSGGRRRAPEPEETGETEETRGRRRAEETGGFSVADLLGRLQSDTAEESGGGRRRRRED